MRRRLVSLLSIAFIAGALGCSQHARYVPKTVVVFIDISGSVKDFGVYREAWPKIVAHLHGGDRVVLAAISGQTYTRYRPLIDAEVPTYSPLRENTLMHEQALRQLDGEFSAALEKILTEPRSPRTDIMNSLVLAEKIFKGDPGRRHILVLLSDMLEDSDEYRFEQLHLTESMTLQVIERKRQQRELPDLEQAAVYVGGASAQSPEKAREVERFWREYVTAANGHLLSDRYAPTLIQFKEQ